MDMMHREWNLTNSDVSNAQTTHLSHPHSLSRKLSDHNTNNNNNNTQNHHHSQQSPPVITTTDYSDPPSLAVLHVSQALFHRKSLDAGYDTDGGIETSEYIPRRHHTMSHSVEHLVSPRLPSKQYKQLPIIPTQRRSLHENHLTVNQLSNSVQNHIDRENESAREDKTHRRHIRLSRRIQQSSSGTQIHGTHGVHSSIIPRHDGVLGTVPTGRPLRLIFMRHSERVNQALGSMWFIRAFQSGTYKVYDPLLPKALPRRNSDHAYEFDVPLTVHGLKNARHTGSVMLNLNIVPDVCLSSSALRCIQTSERVLTGMNRCDRVPIRIEPGLFECPHLNHKIVESLMTKPELVENGYNIKLEYKPLIPNLTTPESLDEYFDRATTVMRGIINRYAHRGGNVLIVTHAPGLLALTDAIKGIRPNHDTFYRTVSAYPPLAIYIAEYDGIKWKHSEQPFSITPVGQ
ncbi:unnamed protein product [Adineta steineri]|uniref:Uncharacterized protein n=1 Tax=Adineta steineri TaxID=433720 RepID=A0A814Q3G7_9BILA|nr:unnamed protein product [Adineta steineri]CAF1296927.1 unnamed protein product [Adineta steineri]